MHYMTVLKHAQAQQQAYPLVTLLPRLAKRHVVGVLVNNNRPVLCMAPVHALRHACIAYLSVKCVPQLCLPKDFTKCVSQVGPSLCRSDWQAQCNAMALSMLAMTRGV